MPEQQVITDSPTDNIKNQLRIGFWLVNKIPIETFFQADVSIKKYLTNTRKQNKPPKGF